MGVHKKYAVGDTKVKAGRIVVMCEDREWRLRYRLRMEEVLGRKLSRTEQVHHIDGNPLNDELDNLEVVSLAEHNKIHKKGIKLSTEHCKRIAEGRKKVPLKVYETIICLGCGESIPRKVRFKHNDQKFCSRKCYGIYRKN